MHGMGGFDVQKAKVFNILEEYEIGIMIAIGFQDTYHVLPQRIKKKRLNQEQRKPLFEIAFIEEFNWIILMGFQFVQLIHVYYKLLS